MKKIYSYNIFYLEKVHGIGIKIGFYLKKNSWGGFEKIIGSFLENHGHLFTKSSRAFF